MDRKTIAAVIGAAGAALIVISSILLFADKRITTDVLIKNQTVYVKDKDECNVKFHKIQEDSILYYCYKFDQFDEQMTIYSKWNGTTVEWTNKELRRIRKFMKKAFEEDRYYTQDHTYYFKLVPYITLKMWRGTVMWAELENGLCKISAETVYTIYHWLCI